MFDVASGECELVDFLLTRFNPLDLKTKITVDPRCRVDEQIAPKPVDPDFPELQSEPEVAVTPEPLVVPSASATDPAIPQAQEAQAEVTPSIAGPEAREIQPPDPSPTLPAASEPLHQVPRIEIKLSLPIPPTTTPIAPEPTIGAPTPQPPPAPTAPTAVAPEKEPAKTSVPSRNPEPSANPEPEDIPSVSLTEPSAPKPTPAKGDAPPSASDLLALIQGFHAAAQRYNSETAWEPPPTGPEEGGEDE